MIFIIEYWTLSDAKRTVEIEATSLYEALEIIKADEQKYLFAQYSNHYVRYVKPTQN